MRIVQPSLNSLSAYASKGGRALWIETIAQHFLKSGPEGGAGGGAYEDAVVENQTSCAQQSVAEMPDDRARIEKWASRSQG